jgi:glucokinase
MKWVSVSVIEALMRMRFCHRGMPQPIEDDNAAAPRHRAAAGGRHLVELVAIDIGGTHARFAIGRTEEGRVRSLGEARTLKTAEYASLDTAWEAFAHEIGRELPRAAAVAVAARAQGDLLKFTNNAWMIRPAALADLLGAERFHLVNDFGAVAHAVAQLDESHFSHLSGPRQPLPEEGVISVIGPGTGLGVAQVLRRNGRYDVIETEGGHVDFAPLDSIEDRILTHLRSRYRRVSVERIASGRGLANIYEALGAIEGRSSSYADEKALWIAALSGSDSLAAAALDRFCLTLGAVAGDTALSQGASAVVIAGGLGLRLADRLPHSGFAERFVAKGRFERMMSDMPVKIITHPQPGLYGAAAAFAEKYRD